MWGQHLFCPLQSLRDVAWPGGDILYCPPCCHSSSPSARQVCSAGRQGSAGWLCSGLMSLSSWLPRLCVIERRTGAGTWRSSRSLATHGLQDNEGYQMFTWHPSLDCSSRWLGMETSGNLAEVRERQTASRENERQMRPLGSWVSPQPLLPSGPQKGLFCLTQVSCPRRHCYKTRRLSSWTEFFFLGILEERGGPWAVHLLCRSLGAVRYVHLEAGGQYTDSSLHHHLLSSPSTHLLPISFLYVH